MTFLTVITRRPQANVVIRDDEARGHSLRLPRSLVLARNDVSDRHHEEAEGRRGDPRR